LVDHVIPRVPVRQWVLSLPILLRLLLAAQPKLVTPVLQVVHRVITRHLLGQAGLKADEADSGAVTLIQRLYLPHRLRPTRRSEGADNARCNAPGDGLQAAAVRRHRRFQPARRSALRSRRPAGAGATAPLHHLPGAGQVVLKLKTPWRDGTTHLVMSPLEFMQRLAALVPRPRLHLIRFHGVLAPNAKLRELVVPQQPAAPA